MKKLMFALVAMATITLVSCGGNASNKEPQEIEAEATFDSVYFEEPEDDTIVLADTTEGEQFTETEEEAL